jgi:hypothetical protein
VVRDKELAASKIWPQQELPKSQKRRLAVTKSAGGDKELAVTESRRRGAGGDDKVWQQS